MDPILRRYRERLMFSTIFSSVCIAIILDRVLFLNGFLLGALWFVIISSIAQVYLKVNEKSPDFLKKIILLEEENFNSKSFNWFASVTTMLVFGIFTYINLAKRYEYPVGTMTIITSILFIIGLFWVVHQVSYSK